MLTKSLGMLALLGLTLSGCNGSGNQDRISSPPPPTAITSHGEVAGQEQAPDNPTVAGKVLAWQGIPYARPPLDALRWRAPQPPASWDGVRDATRPASPCVQAQTTRHWVRTSTIIGNEDCLYLDIYRPSRADWQQERLPVYLDQIRSLEWVRDNIDAFGGDPGQITIAGESAGAHNVMTLLVSPQAEGLFHRAMAQSPSMETLSPADAEAFTNEQIDYLLLYRDEAADAAEAADLRQRMIDEGSLEEYLFQIPASDYYAAILAFSSLSTYGAIEDGIVVPAGGWMPAIRAGEYNAVPLIIGANQYERKSFMPLYGGLVNMLFGQPSGDYTWLNLRDVMEGESKEDGTAFTLDDVFPDERDKEIYELAGYHGSRSWRAKYVDELAAALIQQQDDIYAYDFHWGDSGSGPAPFDFIYGAGHAAEIPFFHGNEDGLFGYPFTLENEAGRRDLQDAMMTYVKHFIREGDPNSGCQSPCPPRWMPWSGAGGNTVIVLDADFEEARITMSDEALTLEGTNVDRETAISAYEESEKSAVRYFSGQSPWPTP